MAEGKGYQVIVKISLPPEANYHSGHSLIVQGDTAVEVEHQLGRIIEPVVAESTAALYENVKDQARFILMRFIEFAQQGAVKATLTPPSGETPATPAAAPDPSGGADDLAVAAVPPDLASAAVLKAVAKKTGKSVEELGELTKAQAQALLKGGGK